MQRKKGTQETFMEYSMFVGLIVMMFLVDPFKLQSIGFGFLIDM